MTEAEFYGMMVQTLVTFGVAAFFVERALYIIFQSKFKGRYIANLLEFWGFDLKPWISKAVCLWLVFFADFDVFQNIFQMEASSIGTLVMSGLTMAGGSTWVFKQIRRFRNPGANGFEPAALDDNGETIAFSAMAEGRAVPHKDFY